MWNTYHYQLFPQKYDPISILQDKLDTVRAEHLRLWQCAQVVSEKKEINFIQWKKDKFAKKKHQELLILLPIILIPENPFLPICQGISIAKLFPKSLFFHSKIICNALSDSI